MRTTIETDKTTNGNGKKNGASTTTDTKGTSVDAGIKLIPIEIVNTTITVKGTSSLIVNNWSEKAKEEMRKSQTKQAKGPKEAKNPEACFRGAMYLDVDGNHCVPALAFKNAIVSAARFLDDFKMTVLRGAIFVEGTNQSVRDGVTGARDLLQIKSAPPVMREDMVRVGMGKPDLRYRPEYLDWSIDLPISFNRRVVSLEQLVNLIQTAGFGVGICEWRPEKNGQHGRFAVDFSQGAALA